LNSIAETVTGWTSSEATGKPLSVVYKTVNEFTHEPVEHPIDRVLREGRDAVLNGHTALVSRFGTVTSIAESAAPIRDPAGNLTGAVMVFHDVTAMRHAEMALNEDNVRYRTIFNQGAVGVAVTDLDGRFVQINQKFVDMFGYSIEELQQRTFLELTHAADQNYARSSLQRISTQEVLDLVLEKRCVRKDGVIVWSLSTITLVKDPTGRPQHLIGIVEDITHRKEAEEAQGRLAAVVNSSEDSIISMTLDGVILTWNLGAERMYGYTAQEMIGSTSVMLIPVDRFNERAAICDSIRKGERIEHFETIRERKDGTLFNAAISVSPIADVRGKVIGASKITRDITPGKLAEAVIQETDRRDDELLAILSHELCNRLAPVQRTDIASIGQQAGKAQRRWNHDVIRRQMRHLSSLLDDVSDISRIKRGTLKLQREMTPLARVAEAAVKSARPLIDAKRHVLTVVTNDASAQIFADPARLGQIVTNLLTNAAKYTDPGGRILLRIDCNAGSVLIAVKDSGVGFSPDAIVRMFDVFSQVDPTQREPEDGLGIGLALAKGLVELHGGRIAAHSDGPGCGSEFTVQLTR
jgi:two-component system, chemotaxis family, CheB/CheR fusion protein